MVDSYLILAPLLLLPVAALWRFIGCEFSGTAVAPDVMVMVTPASVNLGPGQAQQFTATANGVPSSEVTWSTDSVAGAPDGLFTAPAPFVLGSPPVKVTATSTSSASASATANVTLVENGANAEFVPPPDLIRQGDWKNVHGQAGFALADKDADLLQLPSFLPALTLPPQSQVFQFQDPSVDPRALQRPGSQDRFSSVWFNNVGVAPALTFDFAFTDFQVHRVAFYFCDFDSQNRTQKIEFFDISQGAPISLDIQTIANFVGGQYLSWVLRGKVRMQITKVDGLDVVLQGIFFNS